MTYSYNPETQTFLAIIIELYPTDDQKAKINEYIIASNYLYDKVVDWCDDQYIKYLNDESYYRILSKYDANKILAEVRKTDPLIQNIPLHICRDAIYNGIVAFRQYINEISNHPVKHYPDNITYSLSIGCSDGEHFYIKDSYLSFLGFNDKSSKGKRVGKIKCQNLGIDTDKLKLYNASVFIDNFGKYYLYATRLVDRVAFPYQKSNPIGIDLGYRLDGSNTIVCSDGSIYCQPDTTHLQSRIKYFQSKVDKDGDNLNLSNKQQDNIRKFQTAHMKLYNALDTFYNQATSDIVQKNPEAIVIEDVFAADLKKRSKHNYINYGVTSSGKIREMLIYKAHLHKIPVYIATSDFKSSYICSRCLAVKTTDLKQRKIFKCEYCGYEIDRDLNASINLANLYNFRNRSLNYNHCIKDIIV